MCNDERKNNNCIEEILNIILILQENANCCDVALESCDKGFLGQYSPQLNYNTRPLMLYLCNGTPLSISIEKDSLAPLSSIFRVEKLDKCCATFRVLIQNNVDGEISYTSTNSFFTVNLGCVCCIKCLNDTYIDNL